MKNLIWMVAALFLVAACGKEEPAEPVAEEEPAAVEALVEANFFLAGFLAFIWQVF